MGFRSGEQYASNSNVVPRAPMGLPLARNLMPREVIGNHSSDIGLVGITPRSYAADTARKHHLERCRSLPHRYGRGTVI